MVKNDEWYVTVSAVEMEKRQGQQRNVVEGVS